MMTSMSMCIMTTTTMFTMMSSAMSTVSVMCITIDTTDRCSTIGMWNIDQSIPDSLCGINPNRAIWHSCQGASL